ncbi:UNVERIFIED_CONTAM: hypothetical protein FKN15_030245 [Acipenser sinensis]
MNIQVFSQQKDHSTQGLAGSYLQELLLEGVGLSTSSLSKTASSYLNALEGSAMALNTKDTSLARDLSKTKENQAVEKARAENRLQNMDFFKAKSEDLKFRIKAAEKLAKLKQETIPMKKKLESFLDLTPVRTITLAFHPFSKLRIEQVAANSFIVLLNGI